MNDPPIGDQDGPRDKHEVQQSKKSVFIPALMAVALAAVVAIPLTRHRGQYTAAPPTEPSPQVEPPRVAADRGETQGTFGPVEEGKRVGLYLSSDIIAACHLSQPAAYFSADSAMLTHEDTSSLEGLVTCLRGGPLSNAVVEIVGQADAAGTSEDNPSLGQNRAESVASYLRTSGLGAERLRTTSAREQNEQADDTRGMAGERRVDIRIAR